MIQPKNTPWRVDIDELQKLDVTLETLGTFWKISGTKNGATGKCRNCGSVEKIRHLGLCGSCYSVADGLAGGALISALLTAASQTTNSMATISKSIVITVGNAELEFRSHGGTFDIKVEDGGDLVFYARNIDKSVIKSLATLV